MIPGVPLGAKIVRLESGIPKDGEYVYQHGIPVRAKHGFTCTGGWVVLAPDNPYGKFLHEVESDIKAAGRERLGGDDYREPKEGEDVWITSGLAVKADTSNWHDSPRLILKPLKRRVLVEQREYPIDECGQVCFYGLPCAASALEKNNPSVYRIEEREA